MRVGRTYTIFFPILQSMRRNSLFKLTMRWRSNTLSALLEGSLRLSSFMLCYNLCDDGAKRIGESNILPLDNQTMTLRVGQRIRLCRPWMGKADTGSWITSSFPGRLLREKYFSCRLSPKFIPTCDKYICRTFFQWPSVACINSIILLAWIKKAL